MEGITIQVDLDHQKAEFSAGSSIKGDLTLTSREEMKYKGVYVGLRWWVQNPKADTMEELDRIQLVPPGSFKGEQKIPFSIDLPNGPVSYEGHLTKLVWSLCAQVDISWRKKVSKTIDICVLAPNEDQEFEYDFGSSLNDQSSLADLKQNWGTALLYSGLISLVLGILLIGSVGLEGSEGGLILSFILTGIGAALTLWNIWQLLVFIRIGRPQLELNPQPLQAGKGAKLTLRISPFFSFTPQEIEALLKCYEQISYDLPRNRGRKTLKHELFCKKLYYQTPVGEKFFKRGEPKTIKVVFDVPSQFPPSLITTYNKVKWELDLRVAIPNWLDWARTLALVVRPEFVRKKELEPGPFPRISSSDNVF